MTESRWPIGPRAARVLYNVADAWLPASRGTEGAADVFAALPAALREGRARRRLERALWLVEWSPRLALCSLRGFSWMPRDERRAWLARLEAGRSRRLRDALHELRRYLVPGA